MKNIKDALCDYVSAKAKSEGYRIPVQESRMRNAVGDYIASSGLQKMPLYQQSGSNWFKIFDFYFCDMAAGEIVDMIVYSDLLAELRSHSCALFILARKKLLEGGTDTSVSAKKHFDMIRELANTLYGKASVEQELSECYLDYQYIIADHATAHVSVSFRLGREIEGINMRRGIK